ncbi:MAG: cyclic nucleotide-binding domain-containing protein [bacterium]
MSIYEIAGLVGVVFYLGSYLALQLAILEGSGYPYASLNLLAAAMILISLSESFNLWSAIIQVSWILISIVGMGLYYFKTRAIRFTPQERAFLDAKFPQISPIEARKFLAAGRWWTGNPGIVIATQGQVTGQLHYMADGAARVDMDGRQIGTVQECKYIGELTWFNGEPATATVTLEQPSRLFSVDASTLQALCARRPDLRLHIENSTKLDTRDKLLAANRRFLSETEAHG